MASPVSRLLMVAGAAVAGWYGLHGVVAPGNGDARPPVTFQQTVQPRTVTDRGSVSLGDLRVGDCLRDETTDATVFSVLLVPCTKKHHGEVFAEPRIDVSPYPGVTELEKRAARACEKKVPAFAREAVDSGKVTLSYLYPSSAESARLDATATCVLESSERVSKPLKSIAH